jgi:dTDP-4-dehydrorhamnose 3,5-epimerase
MFNKSAGAMLTEVVSVAIPEVKVLNARKHVDPRGFFSETYNHRLFAEAGIDATFVQDNHAYSVQKHTLRGLHFQTPPLAQAKLVRVVRGAILDVAVDLRVGSPSFGRHAAAVISANDWNQIFIPIGFAHGLLTLEPNTEVLYKVTNYYSPEHDKGLLWNDPDLRIDWPVEHNRVLLSEKDSKQPPLAELPEYFVYRSEPEGHRGME